MCQAISIEAFHLLRMTLCKECRAEFKGRFNMGKYIVDCINKAEQKIVKMLGEAMLKEGMHEILEKISKMEKEVVDKFNEQNSEMTLKK